MRFIMFMIPNQESYEKGALPTAELVGEMMKFNQALRKPGR